MLDDDDNSVFIKGCSTCANVGVEMWNFVIVVVTASCEYPTFLTITTAAASTFASG
jgi:hypothetical protein